MKILTMLGFYINILRKKIINIYYMIFNSYNDFDEFDESDDSDDPDDLNDISLMSFSEIVYEYDLKPDYFISKEDQKIIINEIWTNDNSQISANRIYEFDSFITELIPEKIKLNILNDVLEIYVEIENYEEAAIIRDQIKELH